MNLGFLPSRKASKVDVQINDVLDAMTKETPQSEKYPKMVVYLERLYDVKAKARRTPISWDTIALIGANLLGIVIIVAYEQKHVFTSKAQSQLIRPERQR